MPTTVTLATTLMQLGTDLAHPLDLGVTAKVYTPAVTGSVFQYAGGRYRAVSQQGFGRSLDVTFSLVDLETRTTLESWAGQLVCYRDPQGQKIWGTFFTAKITPKIWPNVADVEIVLTEVTHSEGV